MIPRTLVNGQGDTWVPWIPDSDQVEVYYWGSSVAFYVDVCVQTTSSGYDFSSWGSVVQTGNTVAVDAEIWKWTGVTAPVMLNFTHTYNLGSLPQGDYVFVLSVWKTTVKRIAFVIRSLDTGPIYYESSLGATSTTAGATSGFLCQWWDEVGLSGFIFECNNTGMTQNDTWVSFASFGSGNSLSYASLILNDTSGTVVRWKFYANDTSDDWNGTMPYQYLNLNPEVPDDPGGGAGGVPYMK